MIGFGVRRERSVLGCDENDRFWGATRTIGFGWISAGVRRSRRCCDWCDDGLRWCNRMGFLGLTNGFGHCSTNKLGLWFSGLIRVCFWVRRSRFLGSSESVSGFAISLLSLSLSARLSPEILWSENSNGNHLTPKQGYFPVKVEIIYRWPYFSCVAKHPLLQKKISENDLKSKQT